MPASPEAWGTPRADADAEPSLSAASGDEWLSEQLSFLQLEKQRLQTAHASVSRDNDALRREVALSNELVEHAEDAAEEARAEATRLQAQLSSREALESRALASAEATITTLLARLRAAEDDKAALQETLSDELVTVRTALATTRFEFDEASLEHRRRAALLAASVAREAALQMELMAERQRTAAAELQLGELQRANKRLATEMAQRRKEDEHRRPLSPLVNLQR